MKTLKLLLADVSYKEIVGNKEIEINAIQFDSRKITNGDLFVAQRGVSVDGHLYITKAQELGAVAVVCEMLPDEIKSSVTYVVVPDSSIALGQMASNYYNRPSEKMKLVAVTGTNGKTTTATLLYELVRFMGKKAGLLSTVCNHIDNQIFPATHTTSDALDINHYMNQMVEAGCEYCFMEASSHSIHQHRIAGLDFNGAIFSNITHDHLDYHKTFKAYIEAKKALFDGLKTSAFALTNMDDKNGDVMLQNTKAHKFKYSCKRMADFTAQAVEKRLDSTLISFDGQQVWTHFTGDFNVYNLLSVYATAYLLGLDKAEIIRCMSLLMPVSGRFQTITSSRGIVAIVDYAHTPDAVENVLTTILGVKMASNRVITVLGAGGDRDKTKRPEMADMACRYSDSVILTSDNPRSEIPENIIADMRAGVNSEYEGKVIEIVDRKEAIERALSMAEKGDIVLVAGKGHENYQEIKGIKHHFDDKEVIELYFNQNK